MAPAARAMAVLAPVLLGVAVPTADRCGAEARACGDHVLLQRSRPRLERPDDHQLGSTGGSCHTAVEGEQCFGHVMWAKQHGILVHPSWYPGLTPNSSFKTFQSLLHSRGQHGSACPWPCPGDGKPYASQGCHVLSEEQCCRHRDGRPGYRGQACVLVRNVTSPARDVGRPCQPEAFASGRTEWRGVRVGCAARTSTAAAPPFRGATAVAGTTTPAPPLAADHSRPRMCAAFGDPHFITFDGGHTVFVGGKVFWLVKTENVWIQGLSRDSEGKLMGVAVGGPFMRGHRLVLSNVGNATLSAEFDAEPILLEEVDEFHVPHVVDAVREEKWEDGLHDNEILRMRTERAFDIGPWPTRFLRPPRGGVFLFHFQEGVEITATGVDYMSVVVSMPPQPAGHAGYCGNYNGSPADDAEPVVPSWNRPSGPGLEPVPDSRSLFRGLPDGSWEDEVRGRGRRRAAAATSATGPAGAPEQDDARRELLRRVLGYYNCPLHLRETAFERCSEVADERIRGDCVFDVCTTGRAEASDGALAAETALRAEAVET